MNQSNKPRGRYLIYDVEPRLGGTSEKTTLAVRVGRICTSDDDSNNLLLLYLYYIN